MPLFFVSMFLWVAANVFHGIGISAKLDSFLA